MHTVMVVAGGLALLAVCLIAGRVGGDPRTAGVPAAMADRRRRQYVDRRHARGNSVSAELPIFLVVFAVPAIVALIARHYLQ